MSVHIGQFVIIKPPAWDNFFLFGRVENIVLIQSEPIVVYIDKFWGRNSDLQDIRVQTKDVVAKWNEEMGMWAAGGVMNCAPEDILEIDWYNNYYLQHVKQDRAKEMEVTFYRKKPKEGMGMTALREPSRIPNRNHINATLNQLMIETYNSISMELDWTGKNKEYDEALAKALPKRAEERQKKEEARLKREQRAQQLEQARQARAQRKMDKAEAKKLYKDDIVYSRQPYRGKYYTYEMVVAVVGPDEIKGDASMIRDVLYGGKLLSLPVGNVGIIKKDQALAFYTEGIYGDSAQFSIVQTKYPKRSDDVVGIYVVKTLPKAWPQPGPAPATEEPMQVELKL